VNFAYRIGLEAASATVVGYDDDTWGDAPMPKLMHTGRAPRPAPTRVKSDRWASDDENAFRRILPRGIKLSSC